jgi:Cu(I)/Ag(I) efflux system periplasmic protein CusF
MKAIVFAVAVVVALISTAIHAGEMKGMDTDAKRTEGSKGNASTTHKAIGVVKTVDSKAGTVTLDHGPVKTMNWPAMSMTFQVKDNAVMEKLAKGKKVEVEFEQHGKDFVITRAK